MKEDLKPKESLVIQYLLAGESLSSAVKSAGYGVTLQKNPTAVWNRPEVQRIFRDTLIKKGVNNSILATKILEGLDATKVIVVRGDTVEIPDYGVRGQYIDRACKLLSLYPDEESITTVETYEQRLKRLSESNT